MHSQCPLCDARYSPECPQHPWVDPLLKIPGLWVSCSYSTLHCIAMLEETLSLDTCSRYVGELARSCWIRCTIALHPSLASEFTVFASATFSSLPLDTGAPKPVRRRGSAWEFYFHLHYHQDLWPMMYWGVSAKAPLLCVRHPRSSG